MQVSFSLPDRQTSDIVEHLGFIVLAGRLSFIYGKVIGIRLKVFDYIQAVFFSVIEQAAVRMIRTTSTR